MGTYVEGSGTYVGGLIGNNSDTVLYSYYDNQTTGQSDAGRGIPETISEMRSGTPSTDIDTNCSKEFWGFNPGICPDHTWLIFLDVLPDYFLYLYIETIYA